MTPTKSMVLKLFANAEYADMHFVCGFSDGNARDASMSETCVVQHPRAMCRCH
jgi:hypothetical protein